MTAPLIKWVGGKTKLLPELAKRMPPRYRMYYEPFLGGGAMYFHQQPKHAVLNDLNPHLIAFYEAVSLDRDKTARSIHRVFNPRARTLRTTSSKRAHYDHVRDHFNSTSSRNRDSMFRRAALFFFLNKTCFNGLYRVNKDGDFNVPMGDYKDWGTLFNREAFMKSALVAERHRFRCGDYWTACSEATDGDFVYLDPPYDPVSSSSNFTSYTSGGFVRDDQRELAQRATKLVFQGAQVMLSNADTPFIRSLFREQACEWKLSKVKCGRSINSNAKKRGKVGELIITGGY